MINDLFKFLVRVEGLEPPRLAAPEPKSGASTNFATPAFKTQTAFHTALSKGYSGFESKNEFFKKIFRERKHKLFIKRLFFNQVV